MSYKVIFEKSAVKFLQKQPKDQQERILKAVYKLPDVGDIKTMQGHENLYRLRVGSYRVIYSLENEILTVHVLNIGNRGDVYK